MIETYKQRLDKTKYFDDNCRLGKVYYNLILIATKMLENEIRESKDRGSKVYVITDYDADGITSGYIMGKILQNEGVDFEVIVNNRFETGYALPEINALQRGDFVICLDVGTNQIDKIKDYTQQTKRVPFIIDHHLSNNEMEYDFLNEECNLLNFNARTEENAPSYCTAGLMRKVFDVYAKKNELTEPSIINSVKIMSAIGTVADMVSVNNLKDDNRFIIREGQKAMELADNQGEHKVENAVGYLLEQAKESYGRPITTRNIQFDIAPVINACGRLSADAPQMLLNALLENSQYGIDNAIKLNQERKNIKEKILSSDEYLKVYNSKEPINVLISDNIPQGMCGIIASTLSENGKPSIVLSLVGDEYIGSGRNASGYPSLYDTIKDTMATLSSSFGGHDNACGCHMTRENVETLKNILINTYDKIVPEYQEPVFLQIPTDLSIDDVMRLEPFGVDCPVPIVEHELEIATKKQLGNNENWAKFSTTNKDYDYITFSEGKNINVGDKVVARGELGLNTFAGKTSIQINIANADQLEKVKVEENTEIEK